MGWDYETYMNQPVEFIYNCDILRKSEVEEAQFQAKKSK